MPSESYNAILREVRRYKVPTIEEEEHLVERIQQGDKKAVSELVNGNQRLVLTIANKYDNLGLPLEDLFQEGYMGLMEAALCFNPSQGFRFNTYAYWRVRRSILSALSTVGESIHLPDNQRKTLRKLMKIREQFQMDNEREPSNEELSELADVDIEQIGIFDYYARSSTSIDESISTSGDNSISISDTIASDSFSDSDVLSEDFKKELSRVLKDILPKREYKVVSLFYGLDGNEKLPMKEVCKYIGLTKERARQICKKAITRLQNDNLAKKCLKELEND